MKIAIAGIAIESCTFSPLTTTLDDFRLWRGNDLLARYPFLAVYVGVTFVPLLVASALPGGVVAHAAYQQMTNEILQRLDRLGPFQGVYLDMHGAMAVEGLDDAEADFFAAVRAVAGREALLSASYDLHGNVSEQIMRELDLLTAYRTAPHTDVEETRARAVRLLLHCLREGIRPHTAFVPIPALFSGEQTMTTVEPGHRVYAGVEAQVRPPDVLDASLLVGYVWADQPRVGASALACGTDAAATRAAAATLAQSYWDARELFSFPMPAASVDSCIEQAMQASDVPVFISDAGDNVTAGAPGDVPYVLERLLAHGVARAVVASLVDTAAVAACEAAGVGGQVAVPLGGKLDRTNGRPLQLTGTVEVCAVVDGNHQAVLRVGGVAMILTAQREAFTMLEQFRRLGIEPAQEPIIVVKLGYLFPDLQPVAAQSLLALSPGIVNPDVTALVYRHVRRPSFPLDRHMAWQPDLRLITNDGP
ncbi:MAG: M81 family metallopeptidase [Roseiflexaceae bacterium]